LKNRSFDGFYQAACFLLNCLAHFRLYFPHENHHSTLHRGRRILTVFSKIFYLKVAGPAFQTFRTICSSSLSMCLSKSANKRC